MMRARDSFGLAKLKQNQSRNHPQNTALYAVTDLMQRALQWQPDDTPEQRLAKLEQMLSPYRLPVEETVPLLAPLLSLSVPEDRYPGLEVSPQRQRQKTLEALVAMILELSERRPLLFILEDLHWTDPTTLEFLDLLLDQIPTGSPSLWRHTLAVISAQRGCWSIRHTLWESRGVSPSWRMV